MPDKYEPQITNITNEIKGIPHASEWFHGRKSRPKPEEIERYEVPPEIWENTIRYINDKLPYLIEKASESKENGVSHRDPPFKVGCVAIGIEPEQDENDVPGIYQGYNFTPTPGVRTAEAKRCAERNALDIAMGWSKVIAGIVTASKETSTGDYSRADNALHPCKECRIMLRELLRKERLRNETVVINVNDSNKTHPLVEKKTLKELLDLYKDDE